MDNKFVFKALGIKILKNLPIREEIKIIGIINGFFVYPKSYYWVVKGKMPLKYADELYAYRDSLGIRVEGGANCNKPIEWCTSDEFEAYKEEQNELFDLNSMEEFCSNLKNMKRNLLNSKPESFYVEVYHIDKLEGLKKVIDTIKKYDIVTEV